MFEHLRLQLAGFLDSLATEDRPQKPDTGLRGRWSNWTAGSCRRR